MIPLQEALLDFLVIDANQYNRNLPGIQTIQCPLSNLCHQDLLLVPAQNNAQYHVTCNANYYHVTYNTTNLVLSRNNKI